MDSLAVVIKWGNLGKEMESIRKLLQKTQLEAPKSFVHGPWFSMDWEIQVIETLRALEDCARQQDFNLKYF